MMKKVKTPHPNIMENGQKKPSPHARMKDAAIMAKHPACWHNIHTKKEGDRHSTNIQKHITQKHHPASGCYTSPLKRQKGMYGPSKIRMATFTHLSIFDLTVRQRLLPYLKLFISDALEAKQDVFFRTEKNNCMPVKRVKQDVFFVK